MPGLSTGRFHVVLPFGASSKRLVHDLICYVFCQTPLCGSVLIQDELRTRSYARQQSAMKRLEVKAKVRALCGVTYHKLLKAGLEKLVVNTSTTGMFHWRKRVLDHKLYVDVDIDLLKRNPQ